jgi:hypothetical protein
MWMPKDRAHPVLKYFTGTPLENSGGAENSEEKSNINSKKLFCSIYEFSLGSRN